MDQITTYQDTAATTQDKSQLVVLLYDGAIKSLNLAIKELQAGNNNAKDKHIARTLDIITELSTVMDTDAAGEITESLSKLYCFMSGCLSQASINCDPEMIREVINLMEELNRGWKKIAS